MNPEEPLIVSISGVRGIVGGSLDAASVLSRLAPTAGLPVAGSPGLPQVPSSLVVGP